MKPFSSLNEHEIAALDFDQFERYVAYECAERGIRLLPPVRPSRPKAEPIAPDSAYYVVGGLEFERYDDAVEVAALANTKPRVALKHHWEYKNSAARYVIDGRELTPLSVETRPAMTPTQFANLPSQVEPDDSGIDEEIAEYDQIVERREAVRKELAARLKSAQLKVTREITLRTEFEAYLELADNDREIAWRFFERARAPTLMEFPELRDELRGADLSALELPR